MNDLYYDITSAHSIIKYAKELIDSTLREKCPNIDSKYYHGKGSYGQLLEKYYFGYEPNSIAEPDFLEAGIELKSSPLKKLKNGEYRSKERIVLNIIDYCKVYEESFPQSSFYKKNAHLLLVFYLYEENKLPIDYFIKLVSNWEYPKEDLLIIKQDWEKIKQKIIDGKAHEISEGDTFYLGACTKGSKGDNLRKQPNNLLPAKQRAFSLKQGYVNHIIANISKNKSGIYGKIIENDDQLMIFSSFDDLVVNRFKPFYGLTTKQIEEKLGISLNSKAKGYYALLTKAILGIEKNKKVLEFDKADIEFKTVRLKNNDLPKEDISFPAFKYEELIKEKWDDSPFKNKLEKKYFFVFYKITEKGCILKKVVFWNMPYSDIEEAKEIWSVTRKLIFKGKIVKELSRDGRRKTYFPSNRISHVRPHAQNKNDCYPLPVRDKLTGNFEYTKHCFWLNASYVRDEIYLKDV